jgi:hypothetical protein
MTGDKIKKHYFKNIAETPSESVDKFKLIDHYSLKIYIKFIFTIRSEDRKLFT